MSSRLNIRISSRLHAFLAKYAQATGSTVTATVTGLIEGLQYTPEGRLVTTGSGTSNALANKAGSSEEELMVAFLWCQRELVRVLGNLLMEQRDVGKDSGNGGVPATSQSHGG